MEKHWRAITKRKILIKVNSIESGKKNMHSPERKGRKDIRRAYQEG